MSLTQGGNAQIEKCMQTFYWSAAQADARRRAVSSAITWKDTEKIGMALAQGERAQMEKCMRFFSVSAAQAGTR